MSVQLNFIVASQYENERMDGRMDRWVYHQPMSL